MTNKTSELHLTRKQPSKRSAPLHGPSNRIVDSLDTLWSGKLFWSRFCWTALCEGRVSNSTEEGLHMFIHLFRYQSCSLGTRTFTLNSKPFFVALSDSLPEEVYHVV